MREKPGIDEAELLVAAVRAPAIEADGIDARVHQRQVHVEHEVLATQLGETGRVVREDHRVLWIEVLRVGELCPEFRAAGVEGDERLRNARETKQRGVFLVAGRQDNQWPESLFSLRPLTEAGQTLTSKLVGSETNIAYGDPLHWAAIIGLGLVLLVIVAMVTFAGARLEARRDA